jgi:probable F420-dependent oxidoreductase
MDSGIAYFATPGGMSPAAIARLVEERGHESLFFPEHTHIPAERVSPYPGGGELPHHYRETYDLFVACTAAAEATTRLRIGSGICLVVEREPIALAKAVASVDKISGGRFEFGIGAGWNREEMANHGTDPRTRMRLMGERVEAMQAIWTEEEASFHGEFVNFDRIWCRPKPAQRPYPPVLVGGNGPTVLDRVLAYGDAWFPNYALEEDTVIERVTELHQRAERPIDFQAMSAPADAGALERLREAGCSRVVHWVPTAGRDIVEAALERWEAVFAELNGEL